MNIEVLTLLIYVLNYVKIGETNRQVKKESAYKYVKLFGQLIIP